MNKNKLRYRDLNNIEKKMICNGCGGKGSFIKPPNFLFKASCNQHDFYYWRGNTEEDRKKADDEFYKWMLIDIEESKCSKKMKVYYRFWAYLYYKAVRMFGKKFFNYGIVKRNKEDLKRILNKKDKF